MKGWPVNSMGEKSQISLFQTLNQANGLPTGKTMVPCAGSERSRRARFGHQAAAAAKAVDVSSDRGKSGITAVEV